MRNKFLIVALLFPISAAGCAGKKKLPPASVGTSGEAPSIYDEVGEYGTGTDAATAALQRDLAASAGSDRVLFALDSHGLSAAAQQTLVRQVAWLRQHPEVSFTVEGHCDERGTREYNLALGERRAKAAADFLIAQGIAPSRIRTISYGKERPDSLGSDEQSYAANRRAVSIVVRAP